MYTALRGTECSFQAKTANFAPTVATLMVNQDTQNFVWSSLITISPLSSKETRQDLIG